jgi:uncharacterized lipoprotein YmbA
MTPWRIAMRALVALLSLALAGSCTLLPPEPDPSRFFVLTADTSAPAAIHNPSAAASAPTIGVGPVSIPAYLDRPQIVTRVAPNRLDLSEGDRWAEPLKSSVGRVLAENLTALLAPRQVLSYPWYRTANVSLQVKADVERFEAAADRTARLVARWEIVDPANGAILRAGTANVSEAIDSAEPGAAAAGLSRALAAFSREIAAAVVDAAAVRDASKPAHAGQSAGSGFERAATD